MTMKAGFGSLEEISVIFKIYTFRFELLMKNSNFSF